MSPARFGLALGNLQKEKSGDNHVSFVDDSDEVGDERNKSCGERSINIISETINTNFIPSEIRMT